MRLMEGADIYQIAKNCRTSVEMIEKFYASHIKNQLSAAAINVKRPPRNLEAQASAEPRPASNPPRSPAKARVKPRSNFSRYRPQ
jgi:hypothetical protein